MKKEYYDVIRGGVRVPSPLGTLKGAQAVAVADSESHHGSIVRVVQIKEAYLKPRKKGTRKAVKLDNPV